MAEARAAEWAAEKERLQSEKEDLRRALEAKGGLLREEVGRNACLAADLAQAQVAAARLREEAETTAA